MKPSRLMAFTAFLCAGAATPALADWDHVGSIDIGRHHDRDVRTFELGGPVTALQLRADRNINCDSVKATFADGDTREIFSGRLSDGRAKNIDLPDRSQHITRLNFDCEARDEGRDGDRNYGRDHDRNDDGDHDHGVARIEILADVGHYRQDWMRGANWQNTWAKVFNWGSNEINDWKYIGEVSFEGRDDSETAFAGWKGRGSDAIALKPVDANARCSQVTATFENGNKQILAIHNGDYLSKGMYYKLDLPGDRRNVSSLAMRCRATDASSVKIQIFTSK